MTDKELIKQEIERIKKEVYNHNFAIDYSANGALDRVVRFIDSLPEEPKCIYNRTFDERKKFCKYCSAACAVRIEEEPVSDEEIEALNDVRHLNPGLDSLYWKLKKL